MESEQKPGADGPTLDESSLKRLEQWRAVNGPGFPLVGMLYGEADLELAIGFAALFWPKTIEHQGGVFLADGFSAQRFEDWLKVCDGNIEDVQYSMNQRILGDLLPGREDISDENLRYLAARLAEMWQCKLSTSYPSREFRVTSFETNLDYAVTFAAK